MKWHAQLKRLSHLQIKTWFDLGLFLDDIRLGKSGLVKRPMTFSAYEDFETYLSRGTFGLVTFWVSVDGVSVEMGKYLQALRGRYGKEMRACVMVGDVIQVIPDLSKYGVQVYRIEGAQGFSKWGETYEHLFHTKIERGDHVYNYLPKTIWLQALEIVERVMKLVEKEKIRCLLPVNVSANPGNVALSLAMVLLSEGFGLPVFSLNHDFYWEDGKPASARKKGEGAGARDHFFTNYHIGELFSVIRMLYPWNGKHWLQANINREQTDYLIHNLGINPAMTKSLPTAVSTNVFRPLNQVRRERAFYKLGLLFRGFDPVMQVKSWRSSWLMKYARDQRPFIVGAREAEGLEIRDETVQVWLQPTRIINRKRIQDVFAVVEQVLETQALPKDLAQKKLLILITGPIAPGHEAYYRYLLKRIGKMYGGLDKRWRDRVLVGFKFGRDRSEAFYVEEMKDLTVPELYGISSLAFLLSETEGRGLPIIESAASGTPLLVRRFKPDRTYREVVGEGLDAQRQMNVIEYTREGTEDWIRQVMRLLPTGGRARRTWVEHNREVVKRRYSIGSLGKLFGEGLYALWLKTKTEGENRRAGYTAMRSVIKASGGSVNGLVYAHNRTAVPGYSYLRYLSMLRSLIDPSFFREERQLLRGRVYQWAMELVAPMDLTDAQRMALFGAVEEMFLIMWGKETLGIDHTFTYRYRTRRTHVIHQLTEFELYGAVATQYKRLFGAGADPYLSAGQKETLEACGWEIARKSKMLETKVSWKRMMKTVMMVRGLVSLAQKHQTVQLARWKRDLAEAVATDQTQLFFRQVVKNPRPLGVWLGESGENVVMLVFVQRLVKRWLRDTGMGAKKAKRGWGRLPFKVTLLVKQQPFGWDTCRLDLKRLLGKTEMAEMRAFIRAGLVRVVPVRAMSPGVHLGQQYKVGIHALKAIKENDGVLLAHGEENYMLWDLVDIDRFHFGRVEDTLFSQYTGWAKGAYFWQLVPAGLRPVMNYPVPTQQAPAFGKQVQALMARGRNKKQMETIVRLADASGADLSEVVFRASHPGKTQVAGLQLVAGKHPDGVAWTGCAYRCDLGNKHEILVVKARGGKEKMGSMAARASRGRGGKKVVAAVNGGYILNNELVGKIGLREELVGTPLGLVMQGGEIHSLPLFYRPALVTDDRGGVRIDRVGLPGGRLRGVGSKRWLVWTAEMINPEETEGPLVVYTPHYEGKVRFSGRVLVTVCAQKVAAVARPRFLLQKDVYARLLPVGVTYSFDEKVFDSEWQETLVVGRGLEFDLKFGKTFEGAVDALEAGPLLVWEGKEAINVAVEGWSGGYSRQIQAARLDRLDLRGPKIGVGITRKEELIVLVINGRLRDSYGATFGELAKELVALGAWKAMAIDPGGSATLWVEGRVRNIHPYNDDFMEHPYAASPEARGVANGLVVVEK